MSREKLVINYNTLWLAFRSLRRQNLPVTQGFPKRRQTTPITRHT